MAFSPLANAVSHLPKAMPTNSITIVWAASLIVVQGLSEFAASVDVSQVHPQVIVLLDEFHVLGVIICQLFLHLIKTCLDAALQLHLCYQTMIFQIGLVQAEPLALDVNDSVDDTLDVGLANGVVGHGEKVDVAANLVLTSV